LNRERGLEYRRLDSESSALEAGFLLTRVANRLAAALASAAAGRRLLALVFRRCGFPAPARLCVIAGDALSRAPWLRIALGEHVFTGHRQIWNRFHRHRLWCGTRCLDNSDREKVRRKHANARTDRAASATPTWRGAARSHSSRRRWSSGSNELWRLRCGELLADRGRRRGGRNLVVAPAPAEIDQVGVVRVLQDPQEIPFAQALAVSTEKLARRGANLTCSRGSSFVHGPANQIERLLSREAQPGRSDLIAIRRRRVRWRRRARDFGDWSRLAFGSRKRWSRRVTRSATVTIAVATASSSPTAARAIGCLAFSCRCDAGRV
jgi:hypothetical protein